MKKGGHMQGVIEVGDTVEYVSKRIGNIKVRGVVEHIGEHNGIGCDTHIWCNWGEGSWGWMSEEDCTLIKKVNPIITNGFNNGDEVEIVEVLETRGAHYKVGDLAIWDNAYCATPHIKISGTDGMSPGFYRWKLIKKASCKESKEEGMNIDERLLDLYEKGADVRLVQAEIANGNGMDRTLLDMLLVDKKKELLAEAKKLKADREDREKSE